MAKITKTYWGLMLGEEFTPTPKGSTYHEIGSHKLAEAGNGLGILLINTRRMARTLVKDRDETPVKLRVTIEEV